MFRSAVALSSVLLLNLACGDKAAPKPGGAEAAGQTKAPAQPEVKFKGVFGVLPEHFGGDGAPAPAQVELGRMLYHDARLSKNHDVSCNSCHALDKYGVDGLPTSGGHRGQHGDRNSPTVYNAAMHVAQFWDGRAKDVEEQAKGPILNPIEMAMPNAEAVVAVLKSIPGYAEPFAKAFGGDDPISYGNLATAIGAFERTLVTPGRFDTYMAGDPTALKPEEIAGLELFVSTGCTACHSGPGLGGTTFQKLGAVKPYPTKDEGRKTHTGDDADLFMFKVPSLRNVAETAPYFHDGGVATLDEAVKLMAEHQLGKTLSPVDTKSIVTFLTALTGDLPAAEHIAAPKLPESGPDTPAPDPS